MSTAMTAPKQSLLDIKDKLLDMFELLESAGTPEETQAVTEEIARVVSVELATKVDGIAFFDRACDLEVSGLQELIKEVEARIGRINKRKAAVRTTAKMAMQQLGISLMKGSLRSISLRDGKDSLAVTDASLVPDDYKYMSVTLPMSIWENIADTLPPVFFMPELAKLSVTLDNAAIKRDLVANKEVPGAELSKGEDFLVIK